jgi:hypothetical protein
MHDASNDVHAVKVECPPQVDAYALLDDSGQVADLTLMLGSAESKVYRYLQLKYPASNPKGSWTWSRLLTRKAKTKPLSSVLGKLAGLMTDVRFRGGFAIVSKPAACRKRRRRRPAIGRQRSRTVSLGQGPC